MNGTQALVGLNSYLCILFPNGKIFREAGKESRSSQMTLPKQSFSNCPLKNTFNSTKGLGSFLVSIGSTL